MGVVPLGRPKVDFYLGHLRVNNKNKNKEITRAGLCASGRIYLRNGERYSSSVFTLSKAKSHATNWYKPRFCSCYHFRDIIVVKIMNFEC